MIGVFTRLLEAISERLTVQVNRLSSSRKDEIAFGRFLRNEHIEPEAIVRASLACRPPRVLGQHILLVEDTTNASFGLLGGREEMVVSGHKGTKSGFHAHPVLALQADNAGCVGLAAIKIWQGVRISGLTGGEKQAHRRSAAQRSFEHKERYKWVRAIEEAKANLGSDLGSGATYTVVGDREADIYEAFCAYADLGVNFVIRSAKDRVLQAASDEGGRTLYEALDRLPIQHTYSVDLPATPKRSAHTALLQVKFTQVQLLRPSSNRNGKLPQTLKVHVIEISEDPTTVPPTEQPIHWILLTSHPLTNVEQARQVIQWYTWRWVIEQTFRTIKAQGLNLEKSTLQTFHALANLTTLALLAAVQVMQLVQARDNETQQSMLTLLSLPECQVIQNLCPTLEGNTPLQKNPHPPHSLAFAAWVIARLGAWNGYRSQRRPGPITMAQGLVRFYDILAGVHLARSS